MTINKTMAIVLSGNISEYIQTLICGKLEVNVGKKGISVAHRLVQKSNEGIHHSSRIFKMCRREIKSNILKGCRTKKPPFHINESVFYPWFNSVCTSERNDGLPK